MVLAHCHALQPSHVAPWRRYDRAWLRGLPVRRPGGSLAGVRCSASKPGRGSRLSESSDQQKWPGHGLFPGLCLLVVRSAYADDLAYDPSSGADLFKKLAGGAYVVLLVGLLIRVLTRRAKGATSVVRLLCVPSLKKPSLTLSDR